MVVFSTLVHTVASPAAECAALVRYHTKRNSSEYAALVNASGLFYGFPGNVSSVTITSYAPECVRHAQEHCPQTQYRRGS